MPRPAPRAPRRDATRNRERVLAAATRMLAEHGRHVPIAAIAAEAGVGVATVYRSFADRDALMDALAHRAYRLLNEIIAAVDGETRSGREAIAEFLRRTLAIADELVLPLRGAPPLVDPDAVMARGRIERGLAGFIERGGADGTIRATITPVDIIVFSSLLTQALPHLPDGPGLAARQLTLFVAGLGSTTPLPAPAIGMADIEAAFGSPPAGGEKPGPPRGGPRG